MLSMRFFLGLAFVTIACAASSPRDSIAASAALRDSTPAAPQIPPGRLTLHASLSARTLTVRKGGSTITTFPIAVGKDEYPTPPGSYMIRRLIWNPRWVPPNSRWARGKTAKPPGHPENPMRVVKIFIREPDYYIHGTREVESLGTAASHGCLRMAPDDVAALGRLLMQHGGEPRPESWFRRILRFRSQERHVRLSTPIPLDVGA